MSYTTQMTKGLTMKNKTLLSLFALAGVLNFTGCDEDLHDELIRNKAYAPLATMDTAYALPATLIGKNEVVLSDRPYTRLLLDMDGNPNTAEVIMNKHHCCLFAAGELNDAKLGTTKSLDEWKRIKRHEGCASDITDPKLIEKLSPYPATLINKYTIKQYHYTNTLFFFDLDGNPNTTELVMRKYHCCNSIREKLSNARVGQTKSTKEWYNQITQHRGCNSDYYRRFKADVKLLCR